MNCTKNICTHEVVMMENNITDIRKSNLSHFRYDLQSRVQLEQFHKKPICSKYIPNFCIMTILLITGPRNTHPLKVINQWCSFYSGYGSFCIFVWFLNATFVTPKKTCPNVPSKNWSHIMCKFMFNAWILGLLRFICGLGSKQHEAALKDNLRAEH